MIAIGSDHGGYALKQEIIKHLEERKITYQDFGCYQETSCDYPVYAKAVAKAIIEKECELGILICGTGIGISIAANKIPGIRAAAVGVDGADGLRPEQQSGPVYRAAVLHQPGGVSD